MAFSIRMTMEERELVNSYAKLNSLSVAEAFKKALFEKIEDEYDLVLANQACDEFTKGGEVSRPIEEFWAELDL